MGKKLVENRCDCYNCMAKKFKENDPCIISFNCTDLHSHARRGLAKLKQAMKLIDEATALFKESDEKKAK